MYVFASIWHIKVLCSELHPSKIITHGSAGWHKWEENVFHFSLKFPLCGGYIERRWRRRSHDRFFFCVSPPPTFVSRGWWWVRWTTHDSMTSSSVRFWFFTRFQCASVEGRSRSRKVSDAVEKRKKAFRNTLLEWSSAVVEGSVSELDDSHGDANRGVGLLSRGRLQEKLWNVAESGLVQSLIRRK